MSEYIISDEQIAENQRLKGRMLLVMPVVVRCRDCKFGVDGGKYCAEGCADSWDWRNVEPDGFCAWASKRSEQ